MRISKNTIDEVILKADIVDVVGEYVRLRKRGRNYIGLCPFHHEKTPSFTVSEDKQIYHCFGCHKGGNSVNFLMEFKKLSYVETIEELAVKAGVSIEYEEGESKRPVDDLESYFEYNTLVARYFRENLFDPKSEAGKEYLDRRKLRLATIKEFGLGYSLPSRDALYKLIKQNNWELEKALHLGLIAQGNDGSYYDKFAGRVMFPIFSVTGRIVGFGGRTLDPNAKGAKYLNSPESKIYSKSKVLFGLSFSKDSIRVEDKVILIEGYLDFISLYQAGIKNIAAVSGTALTPDQVQILSRYTKNCVLLFDADAAGIKASLRSIELLLRKNFDIKIASLPPGEDPDSYVQKYGKEKFDEVINEAVDFLEYHTNYLRSTGALDNPTKMSLAIRELVRPLIHIEDEIRQALIIKNIAGKFNLPEAMLNRELNVLAGKEPQENRKVIEPKAPVNQGKFNSEVVEDKVLDKKEKELLRLMVDGKRNILKLIFNYLSIDEFVNENYYSIAEIIYERYNKNQEISPVQIIEVLQDEKQKTFISELFAEKYTTSNQWDILSGKPYSLDFERYAKDVVKNFKIYHLDKIINENHKYLQTLSDSEEQLKYIKQNLALLKDKSRFVEEIEGK